MNPLVDAAAQPRHWHPSQGSPSQAYTGCCAKVKRRRHDARAVLAIKIGTWARQHRAIYTGRVSLSSSRIQYHNSARASTLGTSARSRTTSRVDASSRASTLHQSQYPCQSQTSSTLRTGTGSSRAAPEPDRANSSCDSYTACPVPFPQAEPVPNPVPEFRCQIQ